VTKRLWGIADRLPPGSQTLAVPKRSPSDGRPSGPNRLTVGPADHSKKLAHLIVELAVGEMEDFRRENPAWKPPMSVVRVARQIERGDPPKLIEICGMRIATKADAPDTKNSLRDLALALAAEDIEIFFPLDDEVIEHARSLLCHSRGRKRTA
jgi:hypothetical protein